MNGEDPKSTRRLPSRGTSRTSTSAEWSVTTSFEVEPWSPGATGGYFILGQRVKAVMLRFGEPEESPQLRVEWDGEGRIVSVRLTDPEGLSATALQRFPWARWLTVADGALRTLGNPYGGGLDGLRIFAALDHDKRLERALSGERLRPLSDPSRRPGRAGHPDKFYAGVARDYTALRQQGSLRPTADLAKQRGVSRNTMAGWVRRARERGMLPEARGNRPG